MLLLICLADKVVLSHSVLVDDGTCNAMTYISGEMVWRLLGLNKQQELALETLVTKEGAILLDQVVISFWLPTVK